MTTKHIKTTCLLDDIMAAKGVTGYRMGKDLGIRNQSIYQSMTDKNYNPKIKMALAVAKYLGVTLDEMFKIDEKSFNNLLKANNKNYVKEDKSE